MTKSRILSLDAWTFITFSTLYVLLYEDPKGIMLVACLIIYLFIDLFRPWDSMPPDSRTLRTVFLVKMTLILLAISMVTVLPAGIWIAGRRMTGSVQNVHDGQLQLESALDFMRQGKTPYGQDYSNTPMGQRYFNERGLTVNPALHHMAYLPFLLEMAYPPYWLSLKTVGWWDQRLLHIVFLIITLGLLPQLARHPSRKLALILSVGLNPLLMLGFIEGRNDIIMVLFVVLAALAFQREHKTLGVLMFALACAAKQLIWFGGPFVLVYLLGAWPWKKSAWLETVKHLWPAAVIFLATLVPFVAWEPRGFISDVFGYMLGIGDVVSIAKGYGLAGMLLDVGYLKSVTDQFPFSIFELGFGLPAMFFLIRHQVQTMDPRRIWQYAALLGFAVAFWARFFLDNYIGFFVTLIALSAFMQSQADETPRWPDPS